MTINELKDELRTNNLLLGSIQVRINEKCFSPNILGIFKGNNIFFIYDTNDRGNLIILDKGNENDMCNALHRRLKKIDVRNRKKYKK